MTRRRIVGGVVLLALLWLGGCALRVAGAYQEARRGLDDVNAAKRLTTPEDVLRGAPTAPLGLAHNHFQAAHRRLSGPLVAPLKLLPVAGRQLRAADALTGAAARIAEVGRDGAAGAEYALTLPRQSGPERIALLRKLHDIAAEADRGLADVRLGPSKKLVGVLADKRAEVADKLAELRSAAHDASAATAGLAELFAGPRRYLVLAANNAEMRSGSGDFLSVGELTVENGTMALGPLRWTGDLHLDPAKAPPIADADLAARWGFLNPNREWRNLASSPRFEANARLAAAMWPAAGGQPVDGVLALDPIGLQAFLKATGPIEAGARQVDADNVVNLLLHDQYAALPAPGARFDAAQAARRESLGDIARTIFEKLNDRPFDVTTLAGSLSDAAAGRHVLAWSSKPTEQAAWQAARVDGALRRDSLLLAVVNRGGNKLDPFLDVKADLSIGADGAAALTVTLHNATPPGQNVYIAGPYPASGVGAGDYSGYLAVDLPGFAGAISVEGFDKYVAAGPDGPAQVVAVPVIVKRGDTAVLKVRFTLPRSGSMRLEPSARVPGTTWLFEGRTFRDAKARELRWG